MKNIIITLLLFSSLPSYSQQPKASKTESWEKIYRATPAKINDLIHTKLEVSFDFPRSWMYGKEWITLKPHFYPTDSLTLDAKSMEIKEVSLVTASAHIPLKFTYDSLTLHITLNRTYSRGEKYTIFIDYIAKPNTIKAKGSAAIFGAKGLYFINPLGTDKNKPTQVWTQGETESNSGWVPTIDKPNQKTTNEISMTVPAHFRTLSNGLLVNQTKHTNGTRTDTWKMDLPHAPYLMMMAAGEYSVIKDRYENKEVSYYVEKEYAPVARKIFGYTPEMIKYFSTITGVDFPWQKYSQIAVRDYVSGAMENTTATVHSESAQQDARELIDGNSWEDIIAHELFHMWFGDYVTTESWSNIAMNESFADFSEVLWEEYKHGKDAGDEHNYNGMQNYFFSNSARKNLVRFYYRNREELFDAVSYQKGGRILNMLRNMVGPDAFFKSLNLFLQTYKFKAVEVQELRLAFEEVTGEDLNWFWNQWFYGSGHPALDISYGYDQSAQTVKVFIKQTQPDKIYRLPVAIDVYQRGDKKRYRVWLENQADTFAFPVNTRPDLVNVDGDKILLCEKTDHKTIDNYIFQYKNAGLYMDRREAIDFAVKEQLSDPKAFQLLKEAINDRYQGLRIFAIQRLNLLSDSVKTVFEPVLAGLAGSDPSPLIRAAAIEALAKYKKPSYRDLFMNSINDSSYSVAGSALLALGNLDSTGAYSRAKELSSQHLKGDLSRAITTSLYMYADENEFVSLAARFDSLPLGNNKFSILQPFAGFLKKVRDPENFRKGIDMIVRFRDTIPEEYASQVRSYINGFVLYGIAGAKAKMGLTEQADYVKSKITGKVKEPEGPAIQADVLKRYSGEYDYNGETIRVNLKDDKTLALVFPGQTEMELSPVSSTKFSVKFMEGFMVEFITNDKNEVISLTLTSPDEEIKATRKN